MSTQNESSVTHFFGATMWSDNKSMTSNRGQNVHLIVSSFQLVISSRRHVISLRRLVISSCRLVISSCRLVVPSCRSLNSCELIISSPGLVVSSRRVVLSTCRLVESTLHLVEVLAAILNTKKTLAQKTQTAQAQVPMCDSSTWYFNLAIHKLRKFRFCKEFFAIGFPCKHCNILPFCLGLFREEIIE